MSRRRSVLIVMGPVAQGGAEWQLLELLRRLDRERFRPVLASVEFRAYRELELGPGDRAIREQYDALPDVPHHRIRGHGRNSPANARALLGVIRRERIDVVHTNLYAGETWGRVAALLARRPIVTHKRGMPFKSRKPQNVLVDALLNLASARVIVVNEAIRQELHRLQRLPTGRMSVVYPGIDPARWRRADPESVDALRRALGLEPEHRVLLTVGRLRTIKGQRYLLDALPRVLGGVPETRLLLAGHGVLEGELRERARALGVAESVRFLGGRSDVRELLSLADAFVLPSLSEASPVALMEAAFVGVSSVATWVGGVPEVVLDGVTGLLVPPADAAALGGALLELLGDGARRARMGEAATEWAHARFSIERTVMQVEREYERAAGREPC